MKNSINVKVPNFLASKSILKKNLDIDEKSSKLDKKLQMKT